MNREILFRGKRIDNGAWVYGFYAVEDHRHGILYDPNDGIKRLRWVDIDPTTVGQYTGISAVKSYRGSRPDELLVFEGDVVSRKCDVYKIGIRAPVGSRMLVGEVIWSDNKFCEAGNWAVKAFDERGNSTTYLLLADYTITGNIHDNPILIGEV